MQDCTVYEEGTGTRLGCETANEYFVEQMMTAVEIILFIAVALVWLSLFISNRRLKREEKKWLEYLKELDEQDAIDKK